MQTAKEILMKIHFNFPTYLGNTLLPIPLFACKGPSINDVTHLERRGYLLLLHKPTKGDKGEGGFLNLKNWVTSFMDGPKLTIKLGRA